ncbi:MarR family transcriptional regulator [Blastopirellula marina]|uniref:MarR family transcriptional regulator n=1 Tax=Blastopirellula marina TaxID=124 RepID=A0A2S8EYN5_9BACT|nr:MULTISPECIES: MarR family transcriptional regulator [Pirellulaceae]PQO25007.1 MarR family transcriptional regulator [Blastopirellula marina]RCS40859.1 MarR family transcriptional regulator [Bremerella cremea]
MNWKKDDLLCFHLGVAMRKISRIYAEGLAAYEVTPAQLFMLSCLDCQNGQKPSELAEEVHLDASSMTGLLDRTEKAKLIRRMRDPADRRALRIYLTPQGKETVERLKPVIEQLQEKVHEDFFAGCSEEQIACFLEILRSAGSSPDRSS